MCFCKRLAAIHESFGLNNCLKDFLHRNALKHMPMITCACPVVGAECKSTPALAGKTFSCAVTSAIFTDALLRAEIET